MSSATDRTVNDITTEDAAAEWLANKSLIKTLEDRQEDLKLILTPALRKGPFGGVSLGSKSNGFNDSLVPILKAKGLRSAIKTKETPIAAKVADAVKDGKITDAEIDEHRKPRSEFPKEA